MNLLASTSALCLLAGRPEPAQVQGRGAPAAQRDVGAKAEEARAEGGEVLSSLCRSAVWKKKRLVFQQLSDIKGLGPLVMENSWRLSPASAHCPHVACEVP